MTDTLLDATEALLEALDLLRGEGVNLDETAPAVARAYGPVRAEVDRLRAGQALAKARADLAKLEAEQAALRARADELAVAAAAPKRRRRRATTSTN